ncbi:PREDICTED: uncharacterized protein LOC108549994 [Eufriesea mexicana]|uniref:uncharacterized protein LOC108549994 n=1 Tax=Eufriesea mexicana TaxID=516756 RepID=UPI00083C1270|nr:PREDICTED: uncharacterized protein LOC108549994 [Eufriesea mexicana]
MQTTTIEKKRNKYKKKFNYKEKKIYRYKIESKDKEEIKTDDEKKVIPKIAQKVSEDIRKVFLSTIDPHDTPLKWWKTEHVKYAINYPPVKYRLEKVMESHIVRLTDRKYMLLLMTKLYEDHVEEQNIRIEKRKLSPPLIISRLLKLSYKVLSEKMHEPRYTKLKLYV